MSLLDDLKNIHTTLTADVLPRAKDAITGLEDALHKAEDGQPIDGVFEAFTVIRDIVTEVETTLRSTATIATTEPVTAQAPNLGGLSILDVANAQPTPIVAPIPTDAITPAPEPTDGADDTTSPSGDTAASADSTPPTAQ